MTHKKLAVYLLVPEINIVVVDKMMEQKEVIQGQVRVNLDHVQSQERKLTVLSHLTNHRSSLSVEVIKQRVQKEEVELIRD